MCVCAVKIGAHGALRCTALPVRTSLHRTLTLQGSARTWSEYQHPQVGVPSPACTHKLENQECGTRHLVTKV